jgi:hypothetical protein
MDALVLDIAVQIMIALSMALLAWGGCLCLAGVSRERSSGTAARAEARFS